MDKASIAEQIRQSALAFVMGWIVGAGLWPMFWDQITNL